MSPSDAMEMAEQNADSPAAVSALPLCPFLPRADATLTAAFMVPHGVDRGPAFYVDALTYAQSLWLQGFPARAILLMNRAMGCDLAGDEPELMRWPMPYAGMVWILRHHHPDQFIGNPRRHWQHLATRMSGPRPEVRTWRAWACWRIARLLLPDMPADEKQIAEEGVREPGEEEIASGLDRWGLPGETALWRECLEACTG